MNESLPSLPCAAGLLVAAASRAMKKVIRAPSRSSLKQPLEGDGRGMGGGWEGY